MTAALHLDGPARLELIHLDEPREHAYWAHVLNVSEDELTKIVGTVGPRAVDVRRHLARVRYAEWQRKARRTPTPIEQPVQPPRGDPAFALIVCCAAAVATTFGALAYNLTPTDEWSAFQRRHGCEAVANSDPSIEALRCPDGHTIVRTRLVGANEDGDNKSLR